MLSWLLLIVKWFVSSPAVSMMLDRFISDMAHVGADVATAAITSVRDAASMPGLSASERFAAAVASLEQLYPNVEKSLVNTLVESAYRAVKSP